MKLQHYLLAVFVMCLAGAVISGEISQTQSRDDLRLSGCLPEDVKLDTVIGATIVSSQTGKAEKETVKQRLMKLKARCKAGKLIDGAKKEIRFYHLQGCWGNPPADYQEILDRQQKELRELKKKYSVIEIACHSSGIMPF